MTDRTVLVTGGAGFLGSTLVDRLLAEGRRVVAVDDLSTGTLANLEQARRLGAGSFEFQRADVVRGGLDAVVERHRPEVVVHLAAPATPAPSVDDPVRDAMVTVVGTIHVLEAARRHGVRKVVHAGSAAVYGTPAPDAQPVEESHRGPATTPHGAAQRAAEEYLRTYAAVHGVRWTLLRLGDVYGPRQQPGAGVVADLVHAVLAGRPVSLPEGGQVRDLVFVDDAVHALARAMDHGDGEAFNVGTGAGTDVDRLFGALRAVTEHQREPLRVPLGPGEPRELVLASRHAAEVLGWKPWTTLEEGLAATLRWATAE